ncbi:MAG: PAS domain S-box protein, partial [bacterium]
VNLQLISHAQGSLFVAFINDISERLHAEATLQESEENYRKLVDNSPDLIYRTDPAGRITFISKSVERMSGYTVEEAIGMNMAQEVYLHARERDIFLTRLSKNGHIEHFDAELKRKDGSTWWASTDAHFLRDKDGHILGVEGITRDVTEQKKGEMAIRESEELFRTTVHAMNEGLVISDKNFKPLFANRRFLELLGIEEEEDILKADISEFLTQESLEKLIHEICQSTLVGKPSRFELQGIRKDGEVRDFLFSGSPMMKDGHFEKGVSTYTDITDLKQAEKKIKASLQEKEILLKEIHHRVKNNMAVIGSLLKLQANGIEDDRIRQALKESQNRIYAMATVHEVLYGSENLSHIELKPYLDKISKTLLHTYAIDPGLVTLRIESDDIRLSLGELSPLGLVVNELLSNALKYAFPDQRQGWIEVIVRKGESRELELTVRDNGVGMPDNIDWRHSSTLGLQLVTSIVENQLDGSVQMEHSNGTIFTIRFKTE